MDANTEKTLIGVAYALFNSRLHLLRLTEIVRHGIRPDGEDGVMALPAHLDDEMKQLAVDFIFACFPKEMHAAIHAAKVDWLRPA